MNTQGTFKRVKIVATIGPASQAPEMIEKLARAGVDVFRLNLSHKSPEEMKENVETIRAAEKRVGRPLAIMGDLAGPKIRIGVLDEPVQLRTDDRIMISRKTCPCTAKKICLNFPKIIDHFERGSEIFLGDGVLKFEVLKVTKEGAFTRVVVGGTMKARMGFSAQGLAHARFALSAKDKRDIGTMVKLGADALAISFVQEAKDVDSVRKLLPAKNAPMLVAKIETMAGVHNAEAILKQADSIMVARGDLGLAVPMSQLPHIQKNLISMARKFGKPVITATQMLESMTHNFLPTRAEVSDVANAVLDGTDAVMLSGETAAGDFPLETVKTMAQIVADAAHGVRPEDFSGDDRTADAISSAVVQTAKQIGAKLIIAFTSSGATARRVARHRPTQPIIALSPDPATIRHMNFVWGVFPYLDTKTKNFDQAIANAHKAAKTHPAAKLKKGDVFLMSAGLPFGRTGSTNLVLAQEV